MRVQLGFSVLATFLLGACSAPESEVNEFSRDGALPDAVVAMAASNQDLQSARLLPEDGCYWYLHNGPVETTLVPLRSYRGNPICMSQVDQG